MKWKLKTDQNRSVRLNMDAINAYVSKWVPGTDLEFSITRKKRTISTPMRKYFFGVVMPGFLEAYFYEPDEKELVHRYLKCKFFDIQPDKHGIIRNKDIPSVFGDDSDVPIDKKQEYVEWVKRKAAQSPDNPIYIPDPGEA